MKQIFTLLLLTFSLLNAQAQVFSVAGPRTKMNVDVNGNHYTFFNLKTGKIVPVADSASTLWHIAFHKTDIIVNSGAAGVGNVGAQLIEQSFLNVVELPSSGYAFEDTLIRAIPSENGKGWYNYSPTTHRISAKENVVIALQWNEGYALVEMLDYNQTVFGYPTGETGHISFRYQYAPTVDVSQKFTQVTNLFAGNEGHQHFDFFNADTVLSHELTNENWQIGFLNTDIILNGGISGEGITQGQMVESTFDDLIYAPEDGYKTDAEDEPAIPGGTDNGWYHYDFLLTHTITPIENTLLVADLGRKYVKVAFISYYKDAPENPILINQAKYYTFKYYLNPRNSNELDHRAKTLGVETKTAELELAVFPNPVLDNVQIKNTAWVNQEITIYNTSGQKMYQLEVPAMSIAKIDFSALPSGMYIVSNGRVSKTIIKQ